MSTRIDGAACQIIPDDLYTSGEPSLNRLAAAAGDRFDVWQRQINRIILAKSADGFWSARNAVLSIPRQTGKTYDIGWVAIHRAARTPGMRIVWTAQHFSVIKDTFESLCAIVLRPEMSGLVDPDHGISLAAGKEEIRFRNGSRIFFRAPNAAHCEASRRSPCSSSTRPAPVRLGDGVDAADPEPRLQPPDHLHGHPARPKGQRRSIHPPQGQNARRPHPQHPLRRIRRRPRRRPTRPRPMEESQPQLPGPHQRRIHRQPVGTSPATTSGAKPSASGTNTPSAAPSTAAKGRKPPSTNAAQAAS
ncbi:phage terminase large subunit [Bifidobacterium bifidum LMG 13195]|uniref:Phage terminase large subunit n=1 Tax=Bifidobacterium bifidum LMG 13195 TaxID=1207542 RepID=A0A286TBY5_BIFBI|nr:phage terminase large subunit [Bifidobacterium bifidum LMG 13195]